MAILPKHNDRYPNYDPSKDLTKEQLQRFTQAANSAQHKREEIREADPSFMQYAKRTALKQVLNLSLISLTPLAMQPGWPSLAQYVYG